MKIFGQAVWRLTAIYTVILLVVITGFSMAFYGLADRELSRPMPVQLMEQRRLDLAPDETSEFNRVIRQRDNEVRYNLLVQLIIIDAAVLVGGAVASYFLARRTLRPINQMVERETRFVSDASHELRTPLTALAMENEVILRDNKASKTDLQKQVESNLEEVKKLHQLSETLLTISREEKITDPKECEIIREQIIKILVENAVKYDPKHRQPKVKRGEKEIRIIDRGAGIAPEDLPHIFERFYRAEKSRTTAGYGLGLPLAQHLASQIGMKITAKNNPKSGTTFTITA